MHNRGKLVKDRIIEGVTVFHTFPHFINNVFIRQTLQFKYKMMHVYIHLVGSEVSEHLLG